ncbi:hypothetical protein BJ742DRAFT_230306 [Cladochytrium replicatum]|nr:hypothetical protein BJ742DRAFT_230306 [Cladochytrium replicatum]
MRPLYACRSAARHIPCRWYLIVLFLRRLCFNTLQRTMGGLNRRKHPQTSKTTRCTLSTLHFATFSKSLKNISKSAFVSTLFSTVFKNYRSHQLIANNELRTPRRDHPLQRIQTRNRHPTPGPGEVLIRVHAIALNLIDVYSAETYPAVIVSEVSDAGTAVGPDVPTTFISPGQRAAGFAPSFFRKGAPDHGAFQKRVIVPYQTVTFLPESISFIDAAVLP